MAPFSSRLRLAHLGRSDSSTYRLGSSTAKLQENGAFCALMV